MPAPIRLRRFIVSPFETVCYLVSGDTSADALVIDPGDEADQIAEAIRTDGLNLCGIVNTHGHVDHIGANRVLKEQFDCPIMIHGLDAPMLTDPSANLSVLTGLPDVTSPTADRLLKDGDQIEAGDLRFLVIHTPGHTPGGVCLYSEGVLFSGDTLFSGSVGRTDFPGGSPESLLQCIMQKLLILPDDTVVYPGHGPETTIGTERRTNPWLQR